MPPKRNIAKPHSRAHRGTVGSRLALVDLPATGCDLPVPRPPAGVEWDRAQRARWRSLWTSPQACQWDETAAGTVALLVTYERLILTGKASAWHAQEARYASENLGLTPKAMAALGWRIVE